MPEEFKSIGEAYQKVSKEGFDAAVRSLGEVNRGFQALAAEVTGYSKNAFEDGIRAWEQLLAAKTVDQAIEIQSQYAKKAYDAYVAQASKLGELYASAVRDAYRPFEKAWTKKVS